MGVQKVEFRPKGDGTYSNVLYPKTSADQVIADDGQTLQQKLATILTTGNRGAANGVAPLGSDSKMPSSYMPTDTNIEARTSDPSAPVVGRIWLRTDL